jgi:5-methylcytosine-specific restriction endonuclease McrA
VSSEILRLRRAGKSYTWISESLGVPKSTVAYHCSKRTRELASNRRRNRRIKIKEQAVTYKGGKCQVCGYSKCRAALEFHHTDPAEKDAGINSTVASGGKSFEAIKSELDKCVLVCSNCHREIHAGITLCPVVPS